MPRTPLLSQIATGSLKLNSLPPQILTAGLSTQIAFLVGLLRQDPTAISLELSAEGHRLVTPDADRWIVDRSTTVAEHFATTGTPVGHGFTAQNVANGTAYYTFDVGRVRAIVLDTINSTGGANGSIDPAQRDWLEMRLQVASRRSNSPTGTVVSQPGGLDK